MNCCIFEALNILYIIFSYIKRVDTVKNNCIISSIKIKYYLIDNMIISIYGLYNLELKIDFQILLICYQTLMTNR